VQVSHGLGFIAATKPPYLGDAFATLFSPAIRSPLFHFPGQIPPFLDPAELRQPRDVNLAPCASLKPESVRMLSRSAHFRQS
jgi:hypothetical protein